MENKIAYCGLNCENCDARTATITDNNELREKTARLWTQLNGVEITKEMINCTGCKADGVKTPFCESFCGIRKCAMSKSLKSCGECDKFSECEIVGAITANNPEALENLKSEQQNIERE